MDAIADVNVLFALVNERHSFHNRVCQWWDQQKPGFQVGICRIAQMALIRLLSNRAAMANDPLSLPEVWIIYSALIQDSAFCFLAEPAGFQTIWIELCQPYRAAPKVLTDAYLAALAISEELPLLTLDKDFAKFPELRTITP